MLKLMRIWGSGVARQKEGCHATPTQAASSAWVPNDNRQDALYPLTCWSRLKSTTMVLCVVLDRNDDSSTRNSEPMNILCVCVCVFVSFRRRVGAAALQGLPSCACHPRRRQRSCKAGEYVQGDERDEAAMPGGLRQVQRDLPVKVKLSRAACACAWFGMRRAHTSTTQRDASALVSGVRSMGGGGAQLQRGMHTCLMPLADDGGMVPSPVRREAPPPTAAAPCACR